MKKDPLVVLQELLHHEIPITKQIGIEIENYDGMTLVLKAPLAPNINHKETAFAGSLNALATVTGWSLIWLILNENNMEGQIVIQDSSINYLKPVTGDFFSECSKPGSLILERFIRIFEKKGIARLELHSEVENEKEVLVTFKGRYVVQRKG